MQTLPENNLHDFGIAFGKTVQFQAQQQLHLNFRLDYYSHAVADGFGASQWTVYNEDVTVSQNNLLKNASVGYSKKIKQNSLLFFTMAYGERIPSANERYGYYLFNRQDMYDYLGNQHLNPEQSVQGELRFEQKFKNIEYHANVFYHHTLNYIYAYRMEGHSQMTIGALGLKTYKNISYAVSQGFEAGAKAQLGASISYIANLKYVFTQTYDGQALPLVPPFKLQHALRYTYKFYQLQLEHDFGAAQNRINTDFGDKATPAFNVFNFRASRNIIIKNTVLQLALACENMFDLLYHEHLDIGQVPRFGRSFNVNLNFIF
jgi:iron complex outermembrane receptor protein